MPCATGGFDCAGWLPGSRSAPLRAMPSDRFAIVSNPRTGRFRDWGGRRLELLPKRGRRRKSLVQDFPSSLLARTERGTQGSNLESPVLETGARLAPSVPTPFMVSRDESRRVRRSERRGDRGAGRSAQHS